MDQARLLGPVGFLTVIQAAFAMAQPPAATAPELAGSATLLAHARAELAMAMMAHPADGGADHGLLHFSHPLIAESPTPDTKVRFDYFFAREPGGQESPGGDRHTMRFEAEYAFVPWLSVEIDVPYTFFDLNDGRNFSHVDELSLALKYANFTFADRGLVLGGGIEAGLPTGDEEKGIGSDHILNIEPFLDLGFKKDALEFVGFLSFGVPLNENGTNESDLELGWHASALYHWTDRIEAILEFNGNHVFGGEEDGQNAVYVTPGFKFQPFDSPNLQVGLGVSLPVTDDREFDVQTVFSVFYHF